MPTSEKARDLLEAYNAAKMMKEEDDNAADMVADLLDRAGRSLIDADKAGDIDECRELLAIEGVDVHIKDCEDYPNYDRTPVIWACARGHLDILVLLVSKGGNINDKDNIGWNCLMWACLNDDLDIAEYLVSKGANINDNNNAGHSCLIIACYNGLLNVAEFLMSKGANIYEISDDGETCFLRYNDDLKVIYRLRKWPTTMAILVLQELDLIYIIDSESLIDLHQYLGRPDDLKTDNEEDYKKDTGGILL
jgi:hypothetical protein